MSVKAFLGAAAALLMLPAGASAKLRPYIPPGNSGANEYVESVPTASGDRSTRNVVAVGDAGSVLAPSTQSALTRAGADGRATAAIANATAPRRRHHGVHASAGTGGGPPVGGGPPAGGGPGGPSQPGSAPVGGVLRSLLGLDGQGGLGSALPVLLIATMLVLAAGRIWRRRTS